MKRIAFHGNTEDVVKIVEKAASDITANPSAYMAPGQFTSTKDIVDRRSMMGIDPTSGILYKDLHETKADEPPKP